MSYKRPFPRIRNVIGSFIERISGTESARLRSQIRELRRDRQEEPTPAQPTIGKSDYSTELPSSETALGLFDGSWTSQLPGRDGPGTALLFDDPRITWLIDELHGVNGSHVLELGPLEAGHTWMLEQAGAQVMAVEANHDAFLRCLVVKNMLQMKSNFVLGDFARALPDGGPWDLVVASGVLYHMVAPEKLIESIAAKTDRIFLWTHYFDADTAKWDEEARAKVGSKWKPDEAVTRTCNGRTIRLVPMLYEESLTWSGFCGGPAHHSYWMYREELLGLLESFGFVHQRISFDRPDSTNGPSFAVLASRHPF